LSNDCRILEPRALVSGLSGIETGVNAFSLRIRSPLCESLRRIAKKMQNFGGRAGKQSSLDAECELEEPAY
jgi:hypothetical protein